MSEGAAFTCPKCGLTSHHPEDGRQGYCGACHEYTREEAARTLAEYEAEHGEITDGEIAGLPWLDVTTGEDAR